MSIMLAARDSYETRARRDIVRMVDDGRDGVGDIMYMNDIAATAWTTGEGSVVFDEPAQRPYGP